MRERHGCTSQRLVLAGEDEEEFNELRDELIQEYKPATDSEKTDVANLIRATWFLARVNRGFDKSQQNLFAAQSDMTEWTPAQHAEFDRMSRYRTREERSYSRALKAVQIILGNRMRARNRAFSEQITLLQIKTRNQEKAVKAKMAEVKEKEKEKEQPVEQKYPPPPPQRFRQIIVISKTEPLFLYPTNDELEEETLTAEPGATVLRHFEFPEGVPPEYTWIRDMSPPTNGFIFGQEFDSVDEWRTHLAYEKASGTGLFLPGELT